ncbi:glycosyltransferase family 2 protein [Cellulomonas oligotrophica]|uniref:Glycosyltransferase involved in cell wall biosynthesis n=1 Tax=Cellulomonas oligotrophica TaxID=931536 RepID=A0A7Y9JWU6_9CELL|nr:glycosyltransferase [Cellulomonas oligotrophica]NYD85236.1 glycosyltransferase involved in cell wall biosynthesis [Cellulomonas oligotrophica]GIG33328.1 hypothetical protein Col01nite_24870 [Cellulomonas oligotrophica]
MSASGGPLFSIVTPVYEPPLDALRAMVRSVRSQSFEDWELVVVDDRSPSEAVRDVLREAAREDPRVRLVERQTNGRIVAASNDGVEAARGEFVVLVDHDDELAVGALARVAREIEAHPDVDYVYSDEDKIDAQGQHYDEFRKPDWSPERLRGQMYTGHLSVLRTSLVREVGAFRPGYDGSQDHDLVLRVTERARLVRHIPEVLYHWRVVPGSAAGDANAKPYAWDAGRRAVADQMRRLGIAGTAEFGPWPGTYRVARVADPNVTVSVVIPTRGGVGHVWGESRCFVVEAVRSLLEHTRHPHLEIVVVYDEPTPAHVLDQLRVVAGDRLVLVPFGGPFNFSAKCNVGVLASSGDVVILMNDDVEVRSDAVVEGLIAPLSEPDVGMTGARLVFADGRLQHGGHVYANGHLAHAFTGALPDEPGPFAALKVNRECSGLTAAFVALRRETYDAVGGLAERLPVNFNDVDLSMKIASAGLRMLWLADVELYHFESQTRVPEVRPEEYLFVTRRWVIPERDRYLPTEVPRF